MRGVSDRDQGFVLPLVLVFIALLSLSILSAAQALDTSQLRLERTRQQSRTELAGASAQARLAYLLLTEPMGHRGLRIGGDRLDASGVLAVAVPNGLRSARGEKVRELIFDGRPYRLDALQRRYIVELEIQDEAGLLNFNGGDEPAIERLLWQVGIRGREAAHLAATLSDFVDADDLRRLEGAEARNYRRTGRAAPRNAPLRNPGVALAAYGWDDGVSPAQARQLFDLVTAAPVAQRLNVNTAPPAVLAAVLGLDDRATRYVVSERQNRTLMSIDDIAAVTGKPLAGGITDLTGLPSRRLLLRIKVHDRLGREPSYEYRTGLTVGIGEDESPLVFQPAAPMQRVPSLEPRQQPWTPFPEVPGRRF